MNQQQLPITAPPAETTDVQRLQISNIIVGEQMIRSDPDGDEAIEQLALDIQRHGLLQPIGVAPADNGNFQLLWGSRRLRAHKMLGLHHISARVIRDSTRSVRAVALAENLQRRQLSVREECQAVEIMTTEQGMSPAEIAAAISKSRAWVMQRLEVPNYPPELATALLEDRIGLGQARELARLPDDGTLNEWMWHAITGSWTVAQTREAVDQLLRRPDVSDAVAAGIEAARNPPTQLALQGTCAVCGTTHPLDQLALVRVCAGGCPPPPQPQQEG